MLTSGEQHLGSRTGIRRKRATIFFAALAVLGLMMRLFAPAGSVVSDLGLFFLIAWLPVLIHFVHFYALRARPAEKAPSGSELEAGGALPRRQRVPG
jgi:hypothetical protein